MWKKQIGRAHVWTPVTRPDLVCRLLLEKKKTNQAYTIFLPSHLHFSLFLFFFSFLLFRSIWMCSPLNKTPNLDALFVHVPVQLFVIPFPAFRYVWGEWQECLDMGAYSVTVLFVMSVSKSWFKWIGHCECIISHLKILEWSLLSLLFFPKLFNITSGVIYVRNLVMEVLARPNVLNASFLGHTLYVWITCLCNLTKKLQNHCTVPLLRPDSSCVWACCS